MISLRFAIQTGALAASALVAAAVMTTPPAAAQSQVTRTTDNGQTLTLAAGKSAIVDLPRDAAEIFVANPKVANAVVRTPRRLYVMAVDNGQTSIYALDKDGNRIANIDLRVGRDIGELRNILRAAMPNTNIEVRTVNDTIILLGEVDSAAEAQKAYDIATAFVGYSAVGGNGNVTGGGVSFGATTVVQGKLINSLVIRGRDQVMVKVTVAEVRRSIMKQFGINSNGSWNSPAGASREASAGIDPAGASFSLARSWGSLGARLNMLERNGVARILAEPTITSVSGEAASFLAGGSTQVPVSSVYDTTNKRCVITYGAQNYGVSLNVTPMVLTEGRIQLHVNTTVSEPNETDGSPSFNGCSSVPGMRQRTNETTVELPSGGSVVSAGLLSSRSAQVFQGQPGLMSLPILGTLFRSREYQRQDTELMIILTPYISKPVRADQLARPDDGFVDPSDGQAIFLGRMNRLYSTRSNPQNLQNLKGRVGFIND